MLGADKTSFEEPTITTLVHSSNPDTLKLPSRHNDELVSSKSPHTNKQTGIRRSGSQTVYGEHFILYH